MPKLRSRALAPVLLGLAAGVPVRASPPAPPTDLSVLQRTATSAQLRWRPGPGSAQGFKIRKSTQRGVHPDPWLFPGGKLAAFTWSTDDGLVDNLLYEPSFTSRGLRYTVFVNPALVGNGVRMDWAQIEFLFRQGHEIANHTQHHRALIDDRAISLRYVGGEACTLRVSGDSLRTEVEGLGADVELDLTDPAVNYLVDLVALLDAEPGYESTLLYSSERQYATESRHLDPEAGIQIGQGAPAGTLTTARGVHDDAELRQEILDAQAELETRLRQIDSTYACRTLAYPNHAHRQRAMSILNELDYLGVRDGSPGSHPFYSEGSYLPGFTTTYEVPLSFPRPNNSWDEAFTRQKYQERMVEWKVRHEWAVVMAHGENDSDAQHVEWMIDEISSDPDIWIATFGDVAAYVDSFFTDVGEPEDSSGTFATAWIHRLSETDTTWVVVTAYDDSLQESAWSPEIGIPPAGQAMDGLARVAPPGAAGPRIFPSPFSATTRIEFGIPTAGRVRIEILDVRGARVRGLDLGRLNPGLGRLEWDGRDDGGRRLGSGVYVVHVLEEGIERTGRAVLLR